MDVEDAGVLKVETIMQNIDFKCFAGTINGGPNAVANEMLDSFDQGSVEWWNNPLYPLCPVLICTR